MLDPGHKPVVNETCLPFAASACVVFLVWFFITINIYTSLVATFICLLLAEGVMWFLAYNKPTFWHIAVRLLTSLLPVLFIFYIFGNMLNMWE